MVNHGPCGARRGADRPRPAPFHGGARRPADHSRRALPSPQALRPAGTAPPPLRQGVGAQRLLRMGAPRSRRPFSRDRGLRPRIHDPAWRMDLWRGGSPVRGILGWILSAVQVRRVGRGDAPRVFQRAAARHRRPVLASITHCSAAVSRQDPASVRRCPRLRRLGITTGRQPVVRDSASVAERSARFLHPRGPRPVMALHRRCQTGVRTHTRER
jgi:hypothetical protein